MDKLNFMLEILEQLPLIVNKDKNLSSAMERTLHMLAMQKKQNKAADTKSHVSKYNKHDPKLIKLIELIYTNIRKRFQVLSNAYCYLDFKHRDGVSLQDW